MGESTNESIPPVGRHLLELFGLGDALDARGFPETWSHGAFRAACWTGVRFDEPRSLEGDLNAITRHLRKVSGLATEIHEHARRYQETGEPIVEREAVELAERIKNLTPPIDGRADYIADLAGRCLTLKEGQAAGAFGTESVRWVAGEADRWGALARAAMKAVGKKAGWWRTVTLAVPAELRFFGPDLAFGVHTASWLHRQIIAVARERARRDFPPGSLGSLLYDGGDFETPIPCIDPVEPVRAGPAVSVVPAPVEDTIREYIERAASCPDHWDALARVVDVLTKCRQPLVDALGARNVEVLRTCRRRPDARKTATAPAKALRNQAIIMAVRALERCGIPPTRHRDKRWPARAHGWEDVIDPDYNPPSGCAIVAEVFGMQATAVEKVLS